MKREIDSRIVIAMLAVLVVLVGAVAWWRFAQPSGVLTASQAGLGKPMEPGAIPGRRAAASIPASGPSNRRQ